jgi:hypothetical protein
LATDPDPPIRGDGRLRFPVDVLAARLPLPTGAVLQPSPTSGQPSNADAALGGAFASPDTATVLVGPRQLRLIAG